MSVFVTGCASGIGLDLAHALVQRSHRVCAVDIDVDRLHQQARDRGWPDGRTHVRGLDVTDAEAWRSAIEDAEHQLGPIDTLINVAGFLRPGWVHELDVELAARQLRVNIDGVVYGTRFATERMVKRGRGHVINVASLAALAPIPGLAVYSASKYAVRAFSLAAAQELRPHGVAVTLVCPDAVRTPMLDLQRDSEAAAMTFSGSRELEPSEVTDAILEAMDRKPLQVFLPKHRGWLARAADLVPHSAMVLGPLFRRRGRANQRKRGPA
jgi:3-oxoacyl-[acyl-carrier protein] reductase